MNEDDKRLLELAKKTLKLASLKELAKFLNYAESSANNWYKSGFSDNVKLKIQKELDKYSIKTISNNGNYSFDVLSVKASAGTGISNYVIEVIDQIVLDKSLFRTPIDTNKTKFIQVSGDSMIPTLQDGDFVLINENRKFGIDGIYAVQFNGQIFIKRLKFRLDGSVDIISDNKEYPIENYNPKETQIPFYIIGMKTLSIQR